MTSDPAPIPPDDGRGNLVVADPDDPALSHLAVVGDTYTILMTVAQTAGRYALIDMLIPDGGGPPPHRHDFEETFHVLEGEIEVTLRDATSVATAGQTVNVPTMPRWPSVCARPPRSLRSTASRSRVGSSDGFRC